MSRAFRLGLFIVSTLAILAVGTFLIGGRQSLFSRTYRVTTTFKSVSGLSEGAEVRVGGIHEGTVRQIDLPSSSGGQTFHYDVMKLFEDADHAKLKNESQTNDAGHYLERTPFGTAVIVSSSGMKGDSVELHTVLQARALVVRNYLVKTFKMDDTRLRTMEVAKGPNTTSDLGTVDIIVYPPSVKPPPVVKVPPPPPIK